MFTVIPLSLAHISCTHLCLKLLESLLMMGRPLWVCKLWLFERVWVLERVRIWLLLLLLAFLLYIRLILYQPALILQRVGRVHTASRLILYHPMLIHHALLPFGKWTLLLLLPWWSSVVFGELFLFLIDESFDGARDTSDTFDGVAFVHEGQLLWASYSFFFLVHLYFFFQKTFQRVDVVLTVVVVRLMMKNLRARIGIHEVSCVN